MNRIVPRFRSWQIERLDGTVVLLGPLRQTGWGVHYVREHVLNDPASTEQVSIQRTLRRMMIVCLICAGLSALLMLLPGMAALVGIPWWQVPLSIVAMGFALPAVAWIQMKAHDDATIARLERPFRLWYKRRKRA